MSNRAYLFSLEHLGIKLGLDQIRALVAHLGHPDRAYRSIVVAGTNGKGSVVAMVERGLRAAGHRTGRYSSPHLIDLEERFAIDGVPIAPDALERVAGLVRQAAGHLPTPPSFFEATTALALEVFREARVDVAVLEVGLGGRLDATNVVSPAGVAITSIDLDHEEFLGHTIEAISAEKAGVIKAGATVVLAENPPDARRVVDAVCAQVGVALVYAPDGVALDNVRLIDGRASFSLRTPGGAYGTVTLGLRGRHQVSNAVTAVRLLEALDAAGTFRVTASAIRDAIERVEWPGRLELGRWRGHEVIIDGAHNPAAARALASYLTEAHGRRLPLVVGVMNDKKIDDVLRALAPAASQFVFTAAATPRAARPADLARVARGAAPDVPIIEARDPDDALERAVALGEPVVVAGSLYLAGEIRAKLS